MQGNRCHPGQTQPPTPSPDATHTQRLLYHGQRQTTSHGRPSSSRANESQVETRGEQRAQHKDRPPGPSQEARAPSWPVPRCLLPSPHLGDRVTPGAGLQLRLTPTADSVRNRETQTTALMQRTQLRPGQDQAPDDEAPALSTPAWTTGASRALFITDDAHHHMQRGARDRERQGPVEGRPKYHSSLKGLRTHTLNLQSLCPLRGAGRRAWRPRHHTDAARGGSLVLDNLLGK